MCRGSNPQHPRQQWKATDRSYIRFLRLTCPRGKSFFGNCRIPPNYLFLPKPHFSSKTRVFAILRPNPSFSSIFWAFLFGGRPFPLGETSFPFRERAFPRREKPFPQGDFPFLQGGKPSPKGV